jgi:hypothetical protein
MKGGEPVLFQSIPPEVAKSPCVIQQHDLFGWEGAERHYLPPLCKGGVGGVTDRIFTFKQGIVLRDALRVLRALGL